MWQPDQRECEKWLATTDSCNLLKEGVWRLFWTVLGLREANLWVSFPRHHDQHLEGGGERLSDKPSFQRWTTWCSNFLEPSMTLVSWVIDGWLSITLVSVVIEGSPSTTTLVCVGSVSMTLVISVMVGFPSMTLVKVLTEDWPSMTLVNFVTSGTAWRKNSCGVDRHWSSFRAFLFKYGHQASPDQLSLCGWIEPKGRCSDMIPIFWLSLTGRILIQDRQLSSDYLLGSFHSFFPRLWI